MWIEKLSNNPITLATERKKQTDFEVEKEKEGLFNLISQELENLSTDDLIYIFENLLSHSLEDGKIFMLRLWIPRNIWIHCINTPRFFVKHPDFVNKFRHLISLDKNLKTDFVAEYYLNTTKDFPLQDKKYYLIGDKKSNPHISFFKNFHSENDGFQHSEKADLIVEKMNNIYGKYIKLLDNWQSWKVERHTIDDRSEWRKYWEDTLFPMISRIWKYYPKNFIEIIYDSLPDSNRDIEYPEKQKYVYSILDGYHKNKLEDWFITAEDVQEIVQFLISKNLIDENDVDYIYKKLKYYRPLDTVLYAKVRSAEEKNLKELKQLLETYYWENREENLSLEKNYDSWLYEIKKAKEDLQEREEKEISKKYDRIRYGDIIDWNIYSEAIVYNKDIWIDHRILKNWKEILNEYDELGTCGYINWKIYHTGKKDGKLVLFENWVRILDQYDNIKSYNIIDNNLYCVVVKNGKYILLKNNKEISAEYDEIKFCDLANPEYTYPETERNTRMNIWKRFIGNKNNKWVLLKDKKEVSDEYDKIIYDMSEDWHIYYIASIGKKKCYLKDGEKISWEYDDIIYCWIENWKEYFRAKINNQWFVIVNWVETPIKYNIDPYRGECFYYYIVGWKDYLLVIDDGKYFVVENWEVVSKTYDGYQHCFTRISDWKIYWCIEKHHDWILLENGKELLSWYSDIDFCEIVGWHVYCATKKDDERVLFKDWNEVLTWYDDIRFREKIDWDIYYTAKKDGKIYLVKNWEIFTQWYDEFKHIRQGTWLNWNLYSIVEKDWRRLLLENEMEISWKYDDISECGTLDWKIYHTAKKSNGTPVLLENGREILDWYDNIWVREKVDWNIYCVWKKWKSEVILENWKEISKEYDDICYIGLMNWKLYYATWNDKRSVLIENKIKDTDELKLATQVKKKLDFLNLCMSCGRLTTENLLEVQAKIDEYMRSQYSRDKRNEYSYNWLLGSCAKKLLYIFGIMIKDHPEELVTTINPTADKWNEDKQAESFFDILFNSELPDKVVHEKKQTMWWPSKWWFDDTWKSSTKSDLQEALKEEWLSEISLERKTNSSDTTDKYGIVWDVSMETYNHINSLLTVHQYSWFDFDSATQEEINEYLAQESSRLQWEFQESSVEWDGNAWKILFDKIEDFVSKTRFDDKWQWCEELEKTIDTIKDNLSSEEYKKLNSLLEYLKTDQN